MPWLYLLFILIVNTRSFPIHWLLSGLMVGVLILYRWFFDSLSNLGLTCKFKEWTGLLCPACHSQEALHHFAHFNFLEALQANALVILAFPYLAFWVFLRFKKTHSPFLQQLKNQLYGRVALFVLLAAVFFFWFGRNL